MPAEGSRTDIARQGIALGLYTLADFRTQPIEFSVDHGDMQECVDAVKFLNILKCNYRQAKQLSC